jgi:hypothetical protein
MTKFTSLNKYITMRTLVQTTLHSLNLYSPDAVNLILGTIAHESAFGKYRKQLGGGPALGICQMEPGTFYDIVDNYLYFRKKLAATILKCAGVQSFKADDLVANDRLAIAMCRVHYLRFDEKIPDSVPGYARYWKKYYNTVKGKGTEQEFIANYYEYVT